MPHKHTRREKDLSTYDLPPTQIAQALPVTKLSWKAAAAKGKGNGNGKGKGNAQTKSKQGEAATTPEKNRKRKRAGGDAALGDAPRGFRRLMAFAEGKKFRSGLDDANPDPPSKKRKKSSQKNNEVQAAPKPAADESAAAVAPPVPTIRPGERLSDFAARVDQALPLSGDLVAKNGKDPVGLKVWRTRKERSMHRMYDEWREQDRKIKERREEELDLAEERGMEDDEELGVSWKIDGLGGAGVGAGASKKKKKGKKGRMVSEATEKEEDPWEALRKKRNEAKVGINDVAQAPPEFGSGLKKKLMVLGAAVDAGDIPKSAGSLRRREELQKTRDAVVASYRSKADKRKGVLPSTSP